VLTSTYKLPKRTRPVPRWSWPLVVGIDTSAVGIAALLVRQPRWFADLTRFADLQDPSERCSLAVLPERWSGSLVDNYGRPRAAAVVILGEGPEIPTGDSGFASIAAVIFSGSGNPGFVTALIRHLSHDLALDEAALLAGVERGLRCDVFAERAFLDRTRLRRHSGERASERAPAEAGPVGGVWMDSAQALAARYLHQPFNRESHDASALAWELRRLESQASERRFLQGVLMQDGVPVHVPPQSGIVSLRVWIGPPEAEVSIASEPVDESGLTWDRDQIDLTIALAELRDGAVPAVRQITLERLGRSTEAEFRLPSVPFRGRLIVLREQRFVQTAVVTVGPGGLDIAVECVIRPAATDLLDLIPAEAAIVLNHDADGQPAVTTIVGSAGWTLIPSQLATTTRWFREQLERIADDPESFGDPAAASFTDLMVRLAEHGAELHRVLLGGPRTALVSLQAAAELAGAGRISVLSAIPGDVLPLEFVYDRALSTAPHLKGHLCPNAVESVTRGQCCSDATTAGQRAPARGPQTVCPFGFWGIRKVIERHVGGTETQELVARGIAFAIAPSPSVEDGVATLRTVLAGASNRADLNPTEAWSQARQQLSARLGTNVRFANTWADWAQLVGETATDVLLVLPHAAREAGRTFLEIGGDQLEIVHDLGFYVGNHEAWADGRARAPLVLLLGCGTAAGAAPLEEFTGKFLDAGARAVIGTLSVVRGRFVAPLAVELVSMVLQQNTLAMTPSTGLTKAASSSGPSPRITGGLKWPWFKRSARTRTSSQAGSVQAVTGIPQMAAGPLREGTALTSTSSIHLGELLRDLRRAGIARGEPTALCLIAFGDADWLIKGV
jgi:hypothetical protein